MSDEFLDSNRGLKSVREEECVRNFSRGTPRAMLVVLVGEGRGERALLAEEKFFIGRSLNADLHLDSDAVSRFHAFIELRSGGHVLVDNASTNGSYVNYKPVREAALSDGDQIQIGQSMFKYLVGDNIDSSYHNEFERLVRQDALTGALNQNAFSGEIARIFPLGSEPRYPVTLILFDIDHFRELAEKHGQTAGDLILSFVGEKVHQVVPSPHLFARVGEEEFALLFLGELNDARKQAERILTELSALNIMYDGVKVQVTASAGVVEYDRDLHRLPEALFQAADALLYKAKERGPGSVAS